MPYNEVGHPSDAAHSGESDNTTNLYQYIKEILDELILHDEHFHNRERWLGISGDQSGDDWALAAGLNPFVAVSGNGDFGAAAKVLGIDDTPIIAGNIRFDMHRIVIVDQENATPWILRIIWGSGTAADAESAGQYSDVMLMANIAGPPVRPNGVPVDVRMVRLTAGTDKVWMKAKNATNLDEIDFFVGVHEYDD